MSKAKATDSLEESVEDQIIANVWRWFPVVLALGTVAAGMWLGPGFGVLVLASGAAVAAIASMWGSLRAVFGETPLDGEDAFAIGSPSAEEEQKRAVLRAIKDLQFEHNVGKISDEDYRELIGKYRAEAKRLLRLLDERAAPTRARAEELMVEHMAARGVPRVAEVGVKPRGDDADTDEGDVSDHDDADDADEDGEDAAAKESASDDSDEDADDDSDAEDDDDSDDDADADDDDSDAEDDGDSDADDDDSDAEDDGDSDEDADDDDDEDDDRDDHNPRGQRVTCPKCAVSNEADAAFCKNCATELMADAEEEDA